MVRGSKRDSIVTVDIKKLTSAMGRKEFIMFLNKERMTHKQRILANCYRCMNFYEDGRVDCQVKDCVCYEVMPYRKENIDKRRVRRVSPP